MASGCKDGKEKSIEKPKMKIRANFSKRSRDLQEAIKTANKPGDPVTITFATVELRLSDVQLLRGPQCINDAIISFYYSYLENERYKGNTDILFIPPDTSQCMIGMEAHEMEPLFQLHNMGSKLFAFFVLPDEHDDKTTMDSNHFTLIVSSRPEKAFFYYDACSKTSKPPSKQTRRFIKELGILMNGRNWPLKHIRSNVMLTAYDCGIRLLCMTDVVANYANRFECIEGVEPLRQEAICSKRTDMLKLIFMLGGKITP